MSVLTSLGNGKSFQALSEEYDNFSVPRYSLSIDGREMQPKDLQILNISAKMSSEYKMSSCEITVAAAFDQQAGKFKPDIYALLKPGKLVDLKMGYQKLSGVFMGYINSLSFHFNNGGAEVSVHCLDAKGALVNNQTWKSNESKKISTIVGETLAHCRQFATVKIGTITYDPQKIALSKFRKEVDDYQFLVKLARLVNGSFCVIYDTLYFGKNLETAAKEKVLLKWGESLISFSTEIDISEQVGHITYEGLDPVTIKHFSSETSTVPGSGQQASQIASVVRGRTIKRTTTKAADSAQAAKLAEGEMQARASKFSQCQGETIGIPIIRAGDIIGISGMGNGIDGSYYLTEVVHSFSAQGYTTSFSGRRPKIAGGGSLF
jgi:Phage protein D